MNFTKRLTTAAATAAIIIGTIAPVAFANTNIKVNGNGDKSNNTVNVSNNTSTTVVQGNGSVVINQVDSTAGTGGNKANGNTKGNTTISTGDANSNVNVTVGGSSNTATVTPSCGCNTTTNVTVKNNGQNSTNKVTVASNNVFTAIQTNLSFIVNAVSSVVGTGGNTANSNTGGDTNVTTGSANSNVTVNVTGSSNALN